MQPSSVLGSTGFWGGILGLVFIGTNVGASNIQVYRCLSIVYHNAWVVSVGRGTTPWGRSLKHLMPPKGSLYWTLFRQDLKYKTRKELYYGKSVSKARDKYPSHRNVAAPFSILCSYWQV